MIVLGKVALGIAGVAAAGVGLICSEGMIEVNVVERQPEVHHVYVIAPAMLVPIATHFIPRRDLGDASPHGACADHGSVGKDHSHLIIVSPRGEVPDTHVRMCQLLIAS